MSEFDIALKAVQTYAEMHPRPLHVTQKQAAEMLNISQNTLRKIVSRGDIKLNKMGMISITEIDNALLSRAAQKCPFQLKEYATNVMVIITLNPSIQIKSFAAQNVDLNQFFQMSLIMINATTGQKA